MEELKGLNLNQAATHDSVEGSEKEPTSIAHSGVWDILYRDRFTEEGVLAVAGIHRFLLALEKRAGTDYMQKLYNYWDNYSHETFSILGAFAQEGKEQSCAGAKHTGLSVSKCDIAGVVPAEESLAECPVCGTDIYVYCVPASGNGNKTECCCNCCGASSGAYDTIDEAEAAWNKLVLGR